MGGKMPFNPIGILGDGALGSLVGMIIDQILEDLSEIATVVDPVIDAVIDTFITMWLSNGTLTGASQAVPSGRVQIQ